MLSETKTKIQFCQVKMEKVIIILNCQRNWGLSQLSVQLDFSSGHYLKVPVNLSCAFSTNSAGDSLSLSLSAPPPAHALFLSFSQNKRLNKKQKGTKNNTELTSKKYETVKLRTTCKM